jgi:hypothetical protein
VNKYIHFVNVFTVSCIITAQNPGDDQVDQVWAGVNAFYNYETARAIEILDRARREYPDNPTVHLTWAAARWLHSQANDPVAVTYRTLEQDLAVIIPVYRDLVQRFPDQPIYQLYYGSALGLKARVHLGKKEWFQTLMSAYRGFNIIQSVARDNPQMVDAQLPIGIVEYYAALSNVLVKWAVQLFGLESNRRAGLQKIEYAADHGEFAWIEAKSICAFLYLWVDPDPAQALRHSQTLVEHFPGNYYFNILYVESLIRTKHYAEAHTRLQLLEQKFNDLTAVQQQWYRGYLRYEWALYHFHHGAYATALKEVEEAIAGYGAELDVILTNAWLLKGRLHDLAGERVAARNAYRQCIARANYTAAVEQARIHLQQPYQPVDLNDLTPRHQGSTNDQ